MANLIDKDALVAEIEKFKAEALQKKSQCKRHGLEKIMHQISVYNKMLSFIDTLEVKEVDLEKEIQDIFQKYKNGYNGLIICNKTDFSLIARHFFELGLKAIDK